MNLKLKIFLRLIFPFILWGAIWLFFIDSEASQVDKIGGCGVIGFLTVGGTFLYFGEWYEKKQKGDFISHVIGYVLFIISVLFIAVPILALLYWLLYILLSPLALFSWIFRHIPWIFFTEVLIFALFGVAICTLVNSRKKQTNIIFTAEH